MSELSFGKTFCQSTPTSNFGCGSNFLLPLVVTESRVCLIDVFNGLGEVHGKSEKALLKGVFCLCGLIVLLSKDEPAKARPLLALSVPHVWKQSRERTNCRRGHGCCVPSRVAWMQGTGMVHIQILCTCEGKVFVPACCS